MPWEFVSNPDLQENLGEKKNNREEPEGPIKLAAWFLGLLPSVF